LKAVPSEGDGHRGAGKLRKLAVLGSKTMMKVIGRIGHVVAVLACCTVCFAATDSTIEKGPHFDVHETVTEAQVNGEVVSVTNRFTVVQPGLNYFSVEENAWRPSSDQIDLAQSGATFERAPFKSILRRMRMMPMAR
jgi:hypothetical protein